jgi:D-amino-acid dehydrogenase
MGDAQTGQGVIVIGGGLLGLFSAYYLQQAGMPVTILERGKIGGGASRFNAGLITSVVAPLPAPGTIGPTVRTMFSGDRALYVSPRQLLSAAPFFLRFASNCGESAYARGAAALSDLNAGTLELFRDLQVAGLAGSIQDSGYMMCYSDPSAAHEGHRFYERSPHAVCPPAPVLQGSAVTAAEPSLSPGVAAAFVRPAELWCNPSLLVDELASALRDNGCEVVEGARVTLVHDTAGGAEVESSMGRFTGRAAVVAAGAWSEELGRVAGFTMGIQPGKGYGFSVEPRAMPQRCLFFAQARVIATPIGERLRLAGTMEFGGGAESFERRRIRAIVKAVSPLLVGIDWENRTHEWVAPRPMTPDGLPSIGRMPGSRHVFVATGHNMLGLTLGPATGRVIADMVTGHEPGVDLAPFEVGRFWRWPWHRRDGAWFTLPSRRHPR